jgi:GMP synthase-like glutamine amidotransferase
VFQHAASEHPGSFREVMAARGAAMRPVELDAGEAIPPAADFDALLVMGGPMDVWEEDKHPWLRAEKAAIRAWVAAGRPFLGMCLGAQLLAEACGGDVRLMTAPPEVGIDTVRVAPDPIFAGMGEICPCFQWHGAEVVRLPPGARLLASSAGCHVQAFRVGECAYGLQFHMELTETTAADWGALPEYAAALEAVKGAGAMPALQADVAQNLPALQDAAATIFGNFLKIAARSWAPA